LGLATVAHLGVDGRDDPVRAGAAVKARHAALIDVEVLAHELAQEAMGLRCALV
jgi:hypothetical protein